MGKSITYFMPSWLEYHNDMRQLAQKLLDLGQADGRQWKGILCITRGGLLPTAILAREMNIRHVETVCVSSYHGEESKDLQFIKQPELPDDGQDWLVIDDLSDTGKTFRALRGLYPKALFACVYAKTYGVDAVDVYVKDVPHDHWIVFPCHSALTPNEPLCGHGD